MQQNGYSLKNELWCMFYPMTTSFDDQLSLVALFTNMD